MRDFKAGRDINVEGGIHINNNSTQSKLLVDCTNEELYAERKHRSNLLDKESMAKLKYLAIFWVFVILVFGVAALWFYFKGDQGGMNLLLVLGSFIGILRSIKVLREPNEFEARQIAALNEIKMILRDRGVT